MGFKFTIEYKIGASNRVADALSRRDTGEDDTDPSLLVMFSQPSPKILETILAENLTIQELQELHKAVNEQKAPTHITTHDGLLYFKRRIYLSRESAARHAIMTECHASRTAGHPGEKRTFARIASTFHWRGMRREIQKFVAACNVCQATKYVAMKPGGFIQPLPIPDKVWAAASMDFIVGLPPSQGFTAVMVVVDRLSKYAHFGPLKTGFDAPRVARLFVDTVVKLHGFPEKLLSDRDTIFMSDFWNELLTLSGTKLQFTTAYHPQTDGQSEVTNRALEQYLRAFTFEQPNRWAQFLPWAELTLNCNFNVSIGMSPYKAFYGRDPPNLFNIPSTPSHNTNVAELLAERTEILRFLKLRLSKAQASMADHANRHRRHVEFNVGDKVLLRLQPYRQHSIGKPLSTKLGRRFYGPFAITERIGKVAYRLLLPADSRIHDVFHVSFLKPYVPPLSEGHTLSLPSNFHRNRPIDVPVRASAKRTILIDGLPQLQWLVHWASDHTVQSSWEPAEVLQHHFPHLHLEDKAVFVDGGVDRDSNPQEALSPDQLKIARETSVKEGSEQIGLDDEETENEKEDQSIANNRPRHEISRPKCWADYITK